MITNISSEVFWLACTVALTAAMVIPYAVYRTIKIGGLWQVFLRPLPGDEPFDDKWAHRAYRAHMNAYESIALFAPAAIAVHVTGIGTEMTAMACAIHFWSRVAYAPLYYFKVPIFRTAIWFISLFATLYLVIQIISNGMA